MSVKTFFQQFFAKFKVTAAQGSAFIKIAEADIKAAEAKGRVIAIDAANKVKTDVVTFLKAEAARVHADSDKITADFDDILAKL